MRVSAFCFVVTVFVGACDGVPAPAPQSGGACDADPIASANLVPLSEEESVCDLREADVPLCSGEPFDAPVLDAPCSVGFHAPKRLVVATTDDTSGGVSVASTECRTARQDVAPSGRDTVEYYRDGRLYLIHRKGTNRIDVLDARPGSDFAPLAEFPIRADDVEDDDPNPHAMAMRADGLAFVSMFDSRYVAVLDTCAVDAAPRERIVNTVDLLAFAENLGSEHADQIPEASLMIGCGQTAFVGLQRLDRSNGWTKSQPDVLVPIDMGRCTAAEPDSQHVIQLQGNNLKQVRLDPTDDSGHTVLALTSGIERVNLATGDVEWFVTDAQMREVLPSEFQLQAFAMHGVETAYVVAYNSDFTGTDLWRFDIPVQGGVASAPERVVSGLKSRTSDVIEIVGDHLWFADSAVGGEGLRVFDIGGIEVRQMGDVIPTGLAPYGMIAIP